MNTSPWCGLQELSFLLFSSPPHYPISVYSSIQVLLYPHICIFVYANSPTPASLHTCISRYPCICIGGYLAICISKYVSLLEYPSIYRYLNTFFYITLFFTMKPIVFLYIQMFVNTKICKYVKISEYSLAYVPECFYLCIVKVNYIV